MTEHNDTVVDAATDVSPEATDVTSESEVGGSTPATEPGDGTTGTTGTSYTDDADNADNADAGDAADDVDMAGTDAFDADGNAAEGGHPESGEDASGPVKRRVNKVGDLEREGEVAADFLETLLDIADLDGDIDVDVDGDRAAVSIVDSDEGRVPRKLVGQDGKVLDALQELTRLAVQSATGERSRLMLDVAGHRAERRATLVEIARRAIAEVQASGEPAALEPMSAFERKVVHDEVLAAGLSSESDGVEPRRFVVILPA